LRIAEAIGTTMSWMARIFIRVVRPWRRPVRGLLRMRKIENTPTGIEWGGAFATGASTD
jgi:hypothetical protein